MGKDKGQGAVSDGKRLCRAAVDGGTGTVTRLRLLPAADNTAHYNTQLVNCHTHIKKKFLLIVCVCVCVCVCGSLS